MVVSHQKAEHACETAKRFAKRFLGQGLKMMKTRSINETMFDFSMKFSNSELSG